MKEYKSKGYFTMEDGSKSSVLEDASKKRKSRKDSQSPQAEKRKSSVAKRGKSTDKKKSARKSKTPSR